MLFSVTLLTSHLENRPLHRQAYRSQSLIVSEKNKSSGK